MLSKKALKSEPCIPHFTDDQVHPPFIIPIHYILIIIIMLIGIIVILWERVARFVCNGHPQESHSQTKGPLIFITPHANFTAFALEHWINPKLSAMFLRKRLRFGSTRMLRKRPNMSGIQVVLA